MINYHKKLLKEIELKNFDLKLKEVIINYCDNYLSREYPTDTAKKKGKTAINKVINLLPKCIEQYSWDNYCQLMREIQSDQKIDRKQIVRIPLSEIYQELINKLNELDYLKSYIQYFISDERIIDSALLIDNYYIGTNFPLGSQLELLAVLEYPSRGKDQGVLRTIVNFNTADSFLKELLIGYLVYNEENKKSSYLIYRQFIYYFSSSLNKKLTTITDFDFHLFKHQYRFYSRISRVSKSNESLNFLRILINFYAYLFDLANIKEGGYNLFRGTLINKTILTSLKFSFAYENGYTFVQVPGLRQEKDLNRIAVISAESKAHNRSSNICYFDFKSIKSEIYRQDVKNYFWDNVSLTTKTFSGRFAHIIEFLNLKTEFDQIVINQTKNSNHGVIEISAPFVYHYISYVHSKYEDVATIRHVFKSIRGFIQFNKKKYKISKMLFKLLNENNKEYDGGVTINEADLDIIFNRFKERKNESVRTELFYIIFIMCVTTKLRLGEILNLGIDYKIDGTINGDVVNIRYYTKTSKSQLLKTQITPAKASLLDRAIEITQEVRNKASEDFRPYIFILDSKTYRGKVLKLTSQFQNYFSQIVEEINEPLKEHYTPYNLRSTFIDNVYSKGIEQNISLMVLEEMTGNSSSVAIRHYVRKKDVLDYAEVFSGVQLSSMEIHGEIIEDEEVLNEHYPVEENLGGCLSNTCGYYKCLICKSFVTSTSRIPAFENKINELKTRRDNSSNKYEQKLINEELLLYGAYYAKLIELKEV